MDPTTFTFCPIANWGRNMKTNHPWAMPTDGSRNFTGDVVIESAYSLTVEGELIIESNVHIAPFCLIQAHGGAYIGQNCALSSGVKVYSLSNMPRNPYNLDETVYFSPMANNSAYFIGPGMLKENVGIALNCIILPGVMIGENSFATPNSVLLSSITPNSYVSGNPAKRVKERFKAAVRNE